MRLASAAFAVVLVLLLAGCSSAPASTASPSTSPSPAPGTGATPSSPIAPGNRAEKDLGSGMGVLSPLGSTFTVTIPEGGATGVVIRVSATGTNVANQVTVTLGPCTDTETTGTVAVGGTSIDAKCAEVPAGQHSVTVTGTTGAGVYQATVRGRVLA